MGPAPPILVPTALRFVIESTAPVKTDSGPGSDTVSARLRDDHGKTLAPKGTDVDTGKSAPRAGRHRGRWGLHLYRRPGAAWFEATDTKSLGRCSGRGPRGEAQRKLRKIWPYGRRRRRRPPITNSVPESNASAVTVEEESTSGTRATPAIAVPAAPTNSIIHPSVFTMLSSELTSIVGILHGSRSCRHAKKSQTWYFSRVSAWSLGLLRTITPSMLQPTQCALEQLDHRRPEALLGAINNLFRKEPLQSPS